MENETLSFTLLDEHIRKIPEGQVVVLNTPRWQVPLNFIGTLGIIVGAA